MTAIQKLLNFILTAIFWVGLMALIYFLFQIEPSSLMAVIPRASPYPTAVSPIE